MTELDLRLKSIHERASAASPRPWIVQRDSNGAAFVRTCRNYGDNRLFIKHDRDPAPDEDQAFIALARNLIPDLLSALRSNNVDSIQEDQLAEIESVVRRATSGPWTPFIEEDQPIGGCCVIWIGPDEYGPDMYVWLGSEIAPSADIEFIAHSREDVPLLAGEIRRRCWSTDSLKAP